MSVSGLDSYMVEFLEERKNLLSAMDCYQGVAKKIRDNLNTLVCESYV